MSVYKDPYLAESVGYAVGHGNGHAVGLCLGQEIGHIDGWNAATRHSDVVIERKDDLIDRLCTAHEVLVKQIKQLQHKEQLMEKQAKSLSNVFNENRELLQKFDLLEKKTQSLTIDYEAMLKAFFALVSIARPAVLLASKMSLALRVKMVNDSGALARELQGEDYVIANRYAHNQTMVKRFVPIATDVFNDTLREARQHHAEVAAAAAAALALEKTKQLKAEVEAKASALALAKIKRHKAEVMAKACAVTAKFATTIMSPNRYNQPNLTSGF